MCARKRERIGSHNDRKNWADERKTSMQYNIITSTIICMLCNINIYIYIYEGPRQLIASQDVLCFCFVFGGLLGKGNDKKE